MSDAGATFRLVCPPRYEEGGRLEAALRIVGEALAALDKYAMSVGDVLARTKGESEDYLPIRELMGALYEAAAVLRARVEETK